MPSNQITRARFSQDCSSGFVKKRVILGKRHTREFPAGEILREEFLKPLGISACQLAKHLHVPARRVNDIVLERRGISADTTLGLSR